MKNLFERRFKVEVSYEPVEVKYEHRYHIRCYDLNGGVQIYHSTNVIDKEVKISQEEACETVFNYFQINYGVVLPLSKEFSNLNDSEKKLFWNIWDKNSPLRVKCGENESYNVETIKSLIEKGLVDFYQNFVFNSWNPCGTYYLVKKGHLIS